MSEQKRAPLLSDDDAIALICSIDESPWRVLRDYYERLIDEGKLRVVEEVEVDDFGICQSCEWDDNGQWDNYCGGCGNRIKC